MSKEERAPVNRHALESAASRAAAIVAALRIGEPSSEAVFEAFAELDALPAEVVRDAVAAWIGPLPDLDRMDNPSRVAHGLPLRPLRLRTLAAAKDADLLDLGPLVEEQLRLAGKSWDGKDLAPEERLDGEVDGAFAGTVERRVLADAEAPRATPLFDVLVFADHAGVVFEAGTTKQLALIAYGKVEMRDRRTRVAIEEALATPVTAAPAAPAAPAAQVAAPVAVTPAHAPQNNALTFADAAAEVAAVSIEASTATAAPKKKTAGAAAKKVAPKKKAVAAKKAAPKKKAVAAKKAAPKKKAVAAKKAAPKKKAVAAKKAAPKKKAVAAAKAGPKKKSVAAPKKKTAGAPKKKTAGAAAKAAPKRAGVAAAKKRSAKTSTAAKTAKKAAAKAAKRPAKTRRA